MSHLCVSPRSMHVLLAIGTAAFLGGCGSTTPQLDARFGDAVRQARATQTLNPNASANPNPVLGIDGKAGAAALTRYHDSFRTPTRTFEAGNIGGAFGSN